MSFEDAMAFMGRHEGGVADRPPEEDPGGLTKWGVTQNAYTRWRKRQHLPVQSVRELTVSEWRELGRADYWEAGSCNRMASPLNLVHFDTVFNMGTASSAYPRSKGANQLLQEVLDRVLLDGVIGPQTLARIDEVIRSWGMRELCARYLAARAYYYTTRGHFQANARGWLRRTHDLGIEVGIALAGAAS